jgi:bifunctional non-homologous end joining protein LigD
MGLATYRQRRDFGKTPEPAGKPGKAGKRRALRFYVQRHAASRLHYDFRLELDGVLKSWAVPKGPSLDPRDKRLAMHVEDHPLEYGTFEGVIPKGEYGAGTVLLWDRGTWKSHGDPVVAYAKGHLDFDLAGDKLHGRFTLVRIRGQGGKGDPWLLIKRADDYVSRVDVTAERPESVARRRHARGTKLPLFVPPALCTLVDRPPAGSGWLHEIKLDGYRMLARIEDGKAQLLSRTGQDWTGKFRTTARALADLPVKQALIDGEVVAFDARGVSRFQALVNAIGAAGEAELRYCAFDLLFVDGEDLRERPLSERKARLREVIPEGDGRVRYVDHVENVAFFAQACAAGLEGVVAKKADSPYRSVRSRDWVKVKCHQSEDLVIVGWTDPQGSRSAFGAVLVAVREPGGLRYAGKVGTGFTEASLADLMRRFASLARDTPAVHGVPRLRGVHWLEPVLVAEVRFTEWTDDGILRHPVFLGLREDTPAVEVPVAAPVLPVRITHPERVVFPEAGITKLALAEYYAAVSDRMLPGLIGRPLSLVRCPDGVGKSCFYHRHRSAAFNDAIHPIEVRGLDETETYVYIEGVEGLVGLAQAGVIEIHPWGARIDDLDKPDRLIFDLDPDPSVTWSGVVAAAETVRLLLRELGLESFARVTGGKGVHVVAAITRRYDWDVVKPFCGAIAELLAAADPKRYTTNVRTQARKGKIFLDTLRNGKGATAIASWSARAKPDAPVAVPVTWDELAGLGGGDAFHVGDVLALRGTKDAWEGFGALRQAITVASLKRLGLR